MNKHAPGNIALLYHRKIKKYIRVIAAGFDVETIHRFRVTCKQLRALLRMLSWGGGSVKPHLSKKLQRCYRIAGNIRDLQLQEQRVTAAASALYGRLPSLYLQWLQQQIKNLKKSFAARASGLLSASGKKRRLALKEARLPRKKCMAFIHSKWETSAAMVGVNQWSDKNLHTLRKNLKDIFYNLQSCKAIHGVAAKAVMPIQRKKFQLLLQQLGAFQDKSVALLLLAPGHLEKLDTGNRKLLQQLKSQWAQDKKKLKASIMEQLQQKHGF